MRSHPATARTLFAVLGTSIERELLHAQIVKDAAPFVGQPNTEETRQRLIERIERLASLPRIPKQIAVDPKTYAAMERLAGMKEKS